MADHSTPETSSQRTTSQASSKVTSPREADTENASSKKATPENASPKETVSQETSPKGAISRRRLLGTAGATGLALGAAGGAVGYAATPSAEKTTPLTTLGADAVMFHGKHQPGITNALKPAATSSRSTWTRERAARRRPRCCAAGRRRPSD